MSSFISALNSTTSKNQQRSRPGAKTAVESATYVSLEAATRPSTAPSRVGSKRTLSSPADDSVFVPAGWNPAHLQRPSSAPPSAERARKQQRSASSSLASILAGQDAPSPLLFSPLPEWHPAKLGPLAVPAPPPTKAVTWATPVMDWAIKSSMSILSPVPFPEPSALAPALKYYESQLTVPPSLLRICEAAAAKPPGYRSADEALNAGWLLSLKANWLASMASAFELLVSGSLPWFYVLTRNSAVLFVAEGTAGGPLRAVISPTSSSQRIQLSAQGALVDLPLSDSCDAAPKDGSRQSTAVMTSLSGVTAVCNWLKANGVTGIQSTSSSLHSSYSTSGSPPEASVLSLGSSSSSYVSSSLGSSSTGLSSRSGASPAFSAGSTASFSNPSSVASSPASTTERSMRAPRSSSFPTFSSLAPSYASPVGTISVPSIFSCGPFLGSTLSTAKARVTGPVQRPAKDPDASPDLFYAMEITGTALLPSNVAHLLALLTSTQNISDDIGKPIMDVTASLLRPGQGVVNVIDSQLKPIRPTEILSKSGPVSAQVEAIARYPSPFVNGRALTRFSVDHEGRVQAVSD